MGHDGTESFKSKFERIRRILKHILCVRSIRGFDEIFGQSLELLSRFMIYIYLYYNSRRHFVLIFAHNSTVPMSKAFIL